MSFEYFAVKGRLVEFSSISVMVAVIIESRRTTSIFVKNFFEVGIGFYE